jgi:large subunit ribosomal protein L29
MNAAEIRDLETDDLHGRIAELKEELFNLRFQLATGQLDNHRRMKFVRREVARIRTILRERDFATAAAVVAGAQAATGTASAPAPDASSERSGAAAPAERAGDAGPPERSGDAEGSDES